MRLNFNPVTQNQIFNAYQINQSAAAKTGKTGKAASEEARRDIALISPQGKQGSLVNSLMKQKMNIMEQRDSLISSTKENGQSMDTIKTQLDSFEKQLKDIDQQISEAVTKEMQKQTENSNKNKKPKTKQEIENARLANVMDLSQGLKTAQVVNSTKTRVDGEARVLKSEIELDKMHGASEEALADKKSKLSALESKSAGLVADIGEILAGTAEAVEEQNEIAASKEKDENAGLKGKDETDSKEKDETAITKDGDEE